MDDLSKILNKEQREAVEVFTGPHLVLAGAGTGKTRVLEYRALRLVQRGVRPSSILLLTFTRRAAFEMLSRANRHDRRLKQVSGGTFHSFALKLLRKHGNLLGFENSFSVLDRGDSEDLIGKIINDLNIKERRYFPKKGTLNDIISKSINKELSIAEVLEKDYEHLLEWERHIKLIGDRFAKYKLDRDLLDYDDLLVFLHLLLEKNDGVRQKINDQYQFIMVDEYQDTNKLQAKIVYQLAKNHKNVLIVGDEMQSIYGFRGANFENMIDFPKKFPKSHKITLEENYRSTQEILNLANCVLDQVEGPVYKKYLTSKRSGSEPLYCQFKSQKEEAAWVAEKILQINNQGVFLRNLAVLFRAAYQSAPLEIELASRGIPFKKFGGIRFIETAHVKDVLAHLRVVVNPKDELSLRRILLLLEGVGEKKADELIKKNYKSYSAYNGYKNLKRLFDLLKKIDNKNSTPAEKIAEIVDYYTPTLRRIHDDYPQREADLQALIEIALNYQDLQEMLSDFALEPPDHSAASYYAGNRQDDWLCLSTVHSAKGLEWHSVFLIQIQEGRFPLPKATNTQEEIEEERRLFYVAVTRAKENLFLTSTQGILRSFRDAWFFNKPSRFIEPLIENKVLQTQNLTKKDNA